jgi:tRNA U34 5-carboxymethylaminomethyl modifying GTPase MnmE/TrmE
MERARAIMGGAEICLWVLDAAVSAPTWPPASLAAPRLVVNKVDLPAAWDLALAAGAVQVSACTGAGLETLCESLSHWLVPEPPPPGAAVAFTAQLIENVEAGCAACQAGHADPARRLLANILKPHTAK